MERTQDKFVERLAWRWLNTLAQSWAYEGGSLSRESILRVFWWPWQVLSVTNVTGHGHISGFSHSYGGQCHMPDKNPPHTPNRQQEKGRDKVQSPQEEWVAHQRQVQERRPPSWVSRSHPAHSWSWLNYNPCQNEQHGSHISIKNKTKQNQLWSQMIHTWIISALNNAGNPHITTRLLFPGKCTEAKQGHSLPATEWRLDLGEEYRAAGSSDQGWTISHNAVLQ